jgi:Smg protein
MKQSMLDVLIYLLEEYDSSQADDNERQWLTSELVLAGFNSSDIGRAWGWLDDLAEQVESNDLVASFEKSHSTRVFSAQERARLSFEAQSFLVSLQTSDLIDSVTFELILDRLIALECSDDELNMEQIRWVVLMVSFNRASRISQFVALEQLIFAEPGADIH